MIELEQRVNVAARSPNRADVALFVGAVARRPGVLVDPVTPSARAADPLYRWLEAERWTTEGQRRDRRPLDELLDVPVPIDSFAEFDRLFAWETRPFLGTRTAATYLGMAVRAFFEEGGRRCYVVRVCDPWPVGDAPLDAAARLIPMLAGRPTGSAFDRSTWRGLWHLYGLPEVSFACVPDLPDACAPRPPAPLPLPVPRAPREQFVECSEPALAAPPPELARVMPAPRCDAAGYTRWSQALRCAVEGIERGESGTTLREVQLVAAIPLPLRDAVPRADRDLLAYLKSEHALDGEAPFGLASEFLQLAYPWVRSQGSDALPEGLDTPEGALAGMLARNALLRGTFSSAAGLTSRTVLDVEPPLPQRDVSLRGLRTPLSPDAPTELVDPAEPLAHTPRALHRSTVNADNLVRRVTLLGPTPHGMRTLSDVNTSLGASARQAHVRRLLSAVIRAARRIGESNVFEASGAALWSALESQMRDMLRGLWRAGALAGAREADAYRVRCDRSTMSQNDLDNARVVVEIELMPAPAIERIVVSLALQGGNVEMRAA